MESELKQVINDEERVLGIRANKKISLFNDISSIAALCTGRDACKVEARPIKTVPGASFFNKLQELKRKKAEMQEKVAE